MSMKQDCTAMSSAEAEYVALSASCGQVIWIRTRIQDYGFNYNKIPLYCDSQSAIAISCNPMQHSRTKHICCPYDDGEGPSDDVGEVIVDHQSTDTAKEKPFNDDHVASSMDDNHISEVKYGLNSPVVKMSTVRCFNNMAVQNSWDLFQMDVNNAFLYGDLTEDVYMIPPPSKNDHSLFVKNKDGLFLALLVSVDDIVITGNNNDEILKFKAFLNNKFKIKDLGELKFFLGLEVLKMKNGLCLNQRKYCIELLHECGLLACNPIATPMPENGVLSHKETDNDKFLKNITEAEYRSMASVTCEVMWIVKILKDLNFKDVIPVSLFCDNSSAIQTAANPVMHEKTKHFDVDVHLIREKVTQV
ncbi:ribonuclease H-like domain-containing protein [Tanacetum coccineum]